MGFGGAHQGRRRRRRIHDRLGEGALILDRKADDLRRLDGAVCRLPRERGLQMGGALSGDTIHN
jgi:hypothetical protein